jgi:hypothetical protein
MKINKEWHQANPMPRNPTLEERFAWHVEHSKNCNCRKMPIKLAELIQGKKNSPQTLEEPCNTHKEDPTYLTD